MQSGIEHEIYKDETRIRELAGRIVDILNYIKDDILLIEAMNRTDSPIKYLSIRSTTERPTMTYFGVYDLHMALSIIMTNSESKRDNCNTSIDVAITERANEHNVVKVSVNESGYSGTHLETKEYLRSDMIVDMMVKHNFYLRVIDHLEWVIECSKSIHSDPDDRAMEFVKNWSAPTPTREES